jgi:integrase
MKHNCTFKLDLRKDADGVWIEKNVPLNAKLSFAGDRLNYFTGFRIDKNNWFQGDPENKTSEDQTAVRNTKGLEGKREVTAADINRRLRLMKAALTNLFEPTQVAPDKTEILKALDQACKKGEQLPTIPETDPLLFLPMFRHYIKNSRLAGSRKEYNYSVVKHWERFANKSGLTLTFDTITPDILRAFEKFLLSETVYVKKTKVKKPARGLNALHTIFKMTRTFWNHARKELKQQKIEIQSPFDSYAIPVEAYGTPIYITMDERNDLFSKNIEIERLAQIRDIFIFQCMTGARVGDLCRFTKSNINKGVLNYIARKTKEGNPVTVTVPLTAKAKEILSRYDLPDNRLLPFISDQKYNEYLKELFEVAGLTRTVTRQHPTTREAENVRLCDIASSHMARRTFVGNLFGKQDSAIIASMSGHVANSKAFARYYDVSKELQRSAIALME